MFKISVIELVACLSEVIDLMSEEIKDHHKRVACGAYQLAQACGITGEERRDIVIAAALHDIGGLSLAARKNAALHFEDTNSHAEKGYKLLSGFEPFRGIATLVRYHHAHWNHGNGVNGTPIELGSQIILLADRISVMLPPGILTLTESRKITENTINRSGTVYKPELVETFTHLAAKDVFWLNIMEQGFYDAIMDELKSFDIILSGAHMETMLDLLCNIVDFRSVFTTTHSRGVSIVAEKLAHLMDMSEDDCRTMRIAALLHDIGKLAIPTEILDKPGPLTPYERDIIRTHSYYTDKVLASLSGFEKIQKWASQHHESLNGHGYPYGYQDEELSLGSKIIKVADIFVALMEKRPYRTGMTAAETFGILNAMAARDEVENRIVSILSSNLETITPLLDGAGQRATDEYNKFSTGPTPT